MQNFWHPMKRLLSIILLSLTLLTPAHTTGVLFGLVNKASVSAGAAYAFAGSDFNTGGVGNVWTSTAANIGPAAAGRCVFVLFVSQNNPTLTMTVNTVPMTQAVVDTNNAQASIWYGTVASGSGSATIATTGGNFLTETMLVYYATGLGSCTPRNTASGAASATIGVNSGDFLFALASGSGTASWASSTQSPSGTQAQSGSASPNNGSTADWTIVSTNASFSAATTALTSPSFVTANWR
jgi:hypothetical protein